MKTKIFKIRIFVTLTLLAAGLSGFAGQPHTDTADDESEQVKNYSKSYTVDDNDKLQLDNRYGKITVNTWNRNEFKIDVQIKVAANNTADTKKLLNNVTISDSKEGSVVSFKTNIDRQSRSIGSWLGGLSSSYRKIEVNYTVYMPAKNPLDISNRYGPVNLPNLDGKVVIDLSYGNLTAKSLSNSENEINVGYGSINIENLKGNELTIKYGNLTLGSTDKLTANVSYGAVMIGKLNVYGSINITFGTKFQINDLDKNLKNLSINSSYTNIYLGLSGDENADFNVTVKYGSFNFGSHAINISNKTGETRRGWNPTQNYNGYVGKGNTAKVINITSSYGSVKFE